RQFPHLRRGSWTQLGRETAGVGLVNAVIVVFGNDGVLVDGADADAGDETLPDAGGTDGLERIEPRLPAVEIGNDGNLARIGSPDREVSSAYAVVLRRVRTQFLIGAEVCTFRPEMNVEVR